MKRAWLLAGSFCMLLGSGRADAQGLQLSGRWDSPLGVLVVQQKGKRVVGRVSNRCAVCPFRRGDEVFRGMMLEDSLSGQIRYCLKGKGCSGDGWAPLVMLVAREGRVLSGAAHFKAGTCQLGGRGDKDGVVLRRLRRKTASKPVPAPPDGGSPDAGGADESADKSLPDGGVRLAVAAAGGDPGEPVGTAGGEGEGPLEPEVKAQDPEAFKANASGWRENMEQAASLLNTGAFERARALFQKAIELDPTHPEAFNGMGVTYYARNDYEEALTWYKKALEVEANFGDAYYNMACIYSLQKKKDLAFRYLHIAVLDGFVQPNVLTQDPDLNNLRDDPRYAKILKDMQEKSR